MTLQKDAVTGRIFDIKRFAVHDGPGIRTVLFLKGCPLKCVWCHNPEGLTAKKECAFYPFKCLNCGFCADLCSANIMRDGQHIFLREQCDGCGKCRDICPGKALFPYGKDVTPEEILPALLEDREFYEQSGGGVTLSGGECLLQPAFSKALLSLLKKEGIHTCVDTSGAIPQKNLEAVMEFTDLFLFDVKAIDENVHLACTGKSNRKILENLAFLTKSGKMCEIRTPVVPGFNDGEVEKIKEFLKGLPNITAHKLLPYHDLARSKYQSLGLPDTMPRME